MIICYETGLIISTRDHFYGMSLFLLNPNGKIAISNLELKLSDKVVKRIPISEFHHSPRSVGCDFGYSINSQGSSWIGNTGYLKKESAERFLPKSASDLVAMVDKNIRPPKLEDLERDFPELIQEERAEFLIDGKVPHKIVNAMKKLIKVKANLSYRWVEENFSLLPISQNRMKLIISWMPGFLSYNNAEWADEFFKKYEKPKLLNRFHT